MGGHFDPGPCRCGHVSVVLKDMMRQQRSIQLSNTVSRFFQAARWQNETDLNDAMVYSKENNDICSIHPNVPTSCLSLETHQFFDCSPIRISSNSTSPWTGCPSWERRSAGDRLLPFLGCAARYHWRLLIPSFVAGWLQLWASRSAGAWQRLLVVETSSKGKTDSWQDKQKPPRPKHSTTISSERTTKITRILPRTARGGGVFQQPISATVVLLSWKLEKPFVRENLPGECRNVMEKQMAMQLFALPNGLLLNWENRLTSKSGSKRARSHFCLLSATSSCSYKFIYFESRPL